MARTRVEADNGDAPHPRCTPSGDPSMSARTPTLRITAIAAGLLLSGVALADAHLDPQLVTRLAQTAGSDQLQVVVTYAHTGAPTAADVSTLKALGITRGVTMRILPIAGALATPAEI